MRVLYVDDDPIMTSAVVRMLDSEGFDCDTADLGKSAIDLAKHNKYDIVLLDVMLPDIDGYEVIKQLRSAGLRTPVLLQSGLVDRENDFEGLWLGASEYLLKPFNKTELVDRIQAVLSRNTDEAAPEARPLSDPSIPAEEVDNQRRLHRRFETVQPGTILINGGIDCLIMDMSYGGAALQLPDPDVELPETFDLQLQSGSTLRCSVRWRSGERLGVQGEVLFSDEVITEALKQGDGQPASVLSGRMPEPKPGQVPRDASGADMLQDLEREDPPSSGPEAEDTVEPEHRPEQQREAPPRVEASAVTALEAPNQSGPEALVSSGQAVAAAPTPSGVNDSERPEAGTKAVGPAGSLSRPPQLPPGRVPESRPANDLDDPNPPPLPGAARADDGQVFTVDRGTRLVAESCECDELVVDGDLEAAARARRLKLGREGRFAGSAEVEIAEIRGHYEGKLVVTDRLVIFAGATVSGTTRYRQIVIEAGGALLGQAQLLPKAAIEPVGFDVQEQAVTSAMPVRAAQA